jgi:NTE family protein
MASVFHDTLQADVEQAQRVSQTLANCRPSWPPPCPTGRWRCWPSSPALSLDELAQQAHGTLPAATRNTLMGLGALDNTAAPPGSAAALASYLLFEPDFVNALIAGRADAWRERPS